MADPANDKHKNDRYIDMIDDGKSCNDLVRKVNDLTYKWSKIYDPIQEKKGDCMKLAGLKDTKGANFEHVMMGMFFALVSDCGVT
jgi:hypothetical protein